MGFVTNPKQSIQGLACSQWVRAMLAAGNRIFVPEIADYEVRRELIRVNKLAGIAQLDQLARVTGYLPLTSAAMRQAAVFWAHARQQGRPTAGDKTIDCDVILAAQAATTNLRGVIIATTNVGHLSQFVPAELWQNITP